MDDHEVDGLEVERGSPGRIFANDKEVNTVNGLVTKELLGNPYEHTCWPDGPFDCVNKPKYGCQEQVTIAGSRCSLCHNLNRHVSDRGFSYPGSLQSKVHSKTPKQGAKIDEVYLQ